MPSKTKNKNNKDEGKRDFLVVSTYAMAGIGAASFAWPLIAVSYTHLTLPTIYSV